MSARRRRRGQKRVKAISAAHLARAEKKLRQARFFVDRLQEEAATSAAARAAEVQEYYFSACLSAAQSVFYALDQSTEFRAVERAWRAARSDAERAEFNWMMALRDDDDLVAHVNPDDTGVAGAVLRGALGVYLRDDQSGKAEAPTVCEKFIDHLAALVETVKARRGAQSTG
ncbi:MAG TPA: hypothetical protein VMS64_10315 [Candidatus Methylomirabilis sp.]|nr:hypothetical protein [Candidatus Methylomirabilis sp.]